MRDSIMLYVEELLDYKRYDQAMSNATKKRGTFQKERETDYSCYIRYVVLLTSSLGDIIMMCFFSDIIHLIRVHVNANCKMKFLW
jgi:hypothetical protein